MQKQPLIKTVVNKMDSINTTFRTFHMEVLAGDPNLETETVFVTMTITIMTMSITKTINIDIIRSLLSPSLQHGLK